MAVTVALLQGVNVGKHKRIAMADLKKIIADLGGEDAVTIANSGNIVFRHDDSFSGEELRSAIEVAVSDHVGMLIPTLTRTSEDMRRIVAANPYPHVTDPKCLHVEFLFEPYAGSIENLDFGQDHITVSGSEIYMHLPNKWTGATFDGRVLYKPLGTHHTSRNWNTVTKLADLASSLE